MSTLIHHSDLNPIINNLKSKVRIKENHNCKRRQKKLDFLLKNVTTENYAKISITNFTKENVVIPEKINRISELGIKHPVGGIGNKNLILHKNENLFSHWLAYAQKLEIDSFKIAKIRSLVELEMQKLNNCNTPNTNGKDVKKILN